jgi:hypothetical protein
MEAWHDIEPALILPAPMGSDESREENLAALTFHDLTDDESSAPQRPPFRHPVQRDTGLAESRPAETRQTSETERSTSLSHTKKLTPVLAIEWRSANTTSEAEPQVEDIPPVIRDEDLVDQEPAVSVSCLNSDLSPPTPSARGVRDTPEETTEGSDQQASQLDRVATSGMEEDSPMHDHVESDHVTVTADNHTRTDTEAACTTEVQVPMPNQNDASYAYASPDATPAQPTPSLSLTPQPIAKKSRLLIRKD